jgi:hypothetical protein
MRVYLLGTVFGLLATAIAAADVLRAPLPVDHVAPLPEHTKLPLIAIGRLPAGATSPADRFKPDLAYYASFRDNQLGKNAEEDPNAVEYAAGKLKLLTPIEGSEVVVAVAVPNLPNASVTIGPIVLDGKVLRLSVQEWQSDETIARSKTTNARELRLLYLPPLAAGKYTLQVQWQVLSPARLNQSSDYFQTDERVAQLPFQVQTAGRRAGDEQAGWPSLPIEALQSVKSIPKAPESPPVQVPWLITARRFSSLGDLREAVAVGSCEPFKFLRGHPAQPQPASALPIVLQPAPNKTTYVRIIAPPLNLGEWASVDGIHWNGNHATINCALWTDGGARDRHLGVHPLLLVPLIPPSCRAGLVPITPPGQYNVVVCWHQLVVSRPGDWYVEEPGQSDSMKFEVHP